MMKPKIAAVCALALAAAGCHNSINSVENAQKMGQPSMTPSLHVVTDTSLSRKVGIVGINTGLTPGGFLKVQVELLNHTRSPQNFNYQFEWFDLNGMQINGSSAVMVGDQIDGGESKFISGIAPTAACKDYRLKLIAGQ